MLIEDTLFGRRDKIQTAIERIRAHEPPEGYYVAFSGGKDSIVVYDLIKRAGVKYDAHFNLTTVDPPELIYYIIDNYKVKGRKARYRMRLKGFKAIKKRPDKYRLLEMQVHRPEKTMWRLIPEKRMPPTRKVRYCCEVLKEGGGAGRCVVTGVRWAESVKRSKRRMVENCIKGEFKTYLHPIIDWSAEEVWEYIAMRKLPYCCLYDEGFARIGCIMCPFQGSKGMRRDAERWPKYAAAYKRAFDQTYKKRLEDGVETKRWSCGNDIFNWWLEERKRGKEDPDQTIIFE